MIRDISSVLIISGILLVADAGVTVLWQEPVTAVIAMVKRAQVDQRYATAGQVPLSTLDRSALIAMGTARQRVAYLARRLTRQVPTGDAIGRISIRKIGASFEIVQGTDSNTLEKGPGHYPATAFPGLGRTVAIAGHRTTYLAPFRHIDQLGSGDQIVVRMPYGRFVYVVQYRKIVLPSALWVTGDVGYERLVLSACNPLYSAAQRIIVFARLQEVQPSPQALRGT